MGLSRYAEEILFEECRRDAERWQKARCIFAVEDIERAAEEMKGSAFTEEENLKADAAIDAVAIPSHGKK